MSSSAEIEILAALDGVTCYQTHTWRGVEINAGIRGTERRELLRPEDFAGKRVLDLGCATGAECFAAAEAGAVHVMGIDQDETLLAAAERVREAVAEELERCRIGWYHTDLSAGVPATVRTAAWDTVLCFAISHNIGYRRLWEEVPKAKVVYVEGGARSPLTAATLSSGSWKATLLGTTPANRDQPEVRRPLFRLTRR